MFLFLLFITPFPHFALPYFSTSRALDLLPALSLHLFPASSTPFFTALHFPPFYCHVLISYCFVLSLFVLLCFFFHLPSAPFFSVPIHLVLFNFLLPFAHLLFTSSFLVHRRPHLSAVYCSLHTYPASSYSSSLLLVLFTCIFLIVYPKRLV